MDAPPPARRRQAQPSLPLPVDDPARSARDLLLHSWPGRLFVVATAFKIIVGIVRLFVELPRFLQVLNTAASISLAFSTLYFITRLVFLVQRRLLWRVRRKLILSYIFIGVVPSLLIFGFFLLGGFLVTGTVGAYVFRNGYDEARRNVQQLAEAAALEVGRSPRTAVETVERVQRNGSTSLRYPALSIAFIPARPRRSAARQERTMGAPEGRQRTRADARRSGFDRRPMASRDWRGSSTGTRRTSPTS